MLSAGNSFIVCRKHDVAEHRISTLCRQAGVDGMVQLEENGHQQYKLSFFNNDGSRFKMCFNGSLCAALYLQQDHACFIAEDFGEYEAIISHDNVSLLFRVPGVNMASEKTPLGTCYSLSLTDNHKVVVTNDNFFHSPTFIPLAMKLRAADDIFPAGANVHFIHMADERVYIRHFEKGIEKETLSCGSGCVAAGIILHQSKELHFISPGGKVCLTKHTDNEWSLSGTPRLISLSEL